MAVAFLALSLVMLTLPASRQQQIAGFLRATALRPFIATQEFLTRTRVQTAEISRLRAELDSVTSVLARRRPLAEENRRLRALLRLGERLGPDYTAANVLRPGTEGSESMFLVDVGRADGVGEGAPVIVAEGLVGVVREVRRGRAMGMDWTHPDFRVSAMTLDGADYGIVEPRRGEFREEDRLILTGIPFHTDLVDGTSIVTSGRGGVYPRGIPVGTVDSLAEEEAGWRKSYWIRPAVEVGSVTHVLVALGSSGADLAPAMIGKPSAAPPDTGAPATLLPDTAAREGGVVPDGELGPTPPLGADPVEPDPR